MSSTTHHAPAESAPLVNETEEKHFNKVPRNDYSIYDSAYLNRPRSKSRMTYLWSFIPTTTSRSRGRQCSYDYQVALTDDEDNDGMDKHQTQRSGNRKRSTFWRYLRRVVMSSPVIILSLFGVLHILFAICSRSSPFAYLPDPEEDPNWTDFVASQKDHLTYPTDITRDVTPIPCHSHNDYWRTVPLFDALRWGCTSVEADVWLYPGEDELLVGHNTASLTRNRTFRSLYVDPLVHLLDQMNSKTDLNTNNNEINGVFGTTPSQTLILLVDFKTDGHDLFPAVLKQLQPLREKNYLSHWDGTAFISRPVIIVGTGNTPFDLVISTNPTHREIFFDAPLDKLYTDAPSPQQKRSPAQGNTGTSHTTPSSFNSSNSYYASVPFTSSIGLPLTGRLSSSQLEKIRGQIRGAQSRGLKARYWETPDWPTSLRNYIWTTLVEEGADMLNVDDLRAAKTMDWRRKVRMGWFDG